MNTPSPEFSKLVANLFGPKMGPFDELFKTSVKRQALISLKMAAIKDLISLAVNMPPGILDDEYLKLKGEAEIEIRQLLTELDQWPISTKQVRGG